MKRSEYVKFVQNGKSNHVKESVVDDRSITDPTFARTGRQMIFQPLNIEYRMKYPDGQPLNKENPMHFNEFDKINPDTFKAVREAQAHVSDTKTKLDKLQKQAKKENSITNP